MSEGARKPSVRFDNLLEAFEMGTFGTYSEFRGFIDLDTGEVHVVSDTHELSDEGAEEIKENGNILPLPSKYDLDLGKRLVFAFADRELSDADADKVYAFFDRKGGYRRFRDLLTRKSLLQKWYDFEEAATRKALRDWCEAHDLPVTDD